MKDTVEILAPYQSTEYRSMGIGELRDKLLQAYVDGFNDMIATAANITGQTRKNLVDQHYDELSQACDEGLAKALKRLMPRPKRKALRKGS